MSILTKIFSVVVIVALLGFGYCYYKINSLKDDLKTSENNNIILQQSLSKQSDLINTLKQSVNEIQNINNSLSQEIENKDDAINNLNNSLIDLKNQYKKDPIKANNILNEKIKLYNKCLNDITLNNLDSESCKNFY